MGIELIQLKYPLKCPRDRLDRISKGIIEGDYYGELTREVLGPGEHEVKPDIPGNSFKYFIRVLETGEGVLSYSRYVNDQPLEFISYRIPDETLSLVLQEPVEGPVENPRVKVHTIVNFFKDAVNLST